MNIKQYKSTFIILAVVVIVLIVIIVPLIVLNNKRNNEKYFPKYEEIEINKSLLNDSDKYETIREQLEDDYYFSKIAIMNEYDSDYYANNEFGTKYLESMVWNFVFNYELENDKYIVIDKSANSFCLSKKNLVAAFKELFAVDISDDLGFLPGYYKYVYTTENSYCFYYNAVSRDYNNDISVGVERVSMYGNSVLSDVYVYEYYTTNTPTEQMHISNLKSLTKDKKFAEAKNLVINNLKGRVSHKQIKMNINRNGKHFKYQILSIKTLD